MKKTISGFRYDTTKSIEIGSYNTLFSKNDQMYWQATLYKTERASCCFLAGNGGQMTIFKGKERIIPMTKEEAIAWANQFLNQSAINEHLS